VTATTTAGVTTMVQTTLSSPAQNAIAIGTSAKRTATTPS
jgi:hypothetical protein